MPGLVEAVLDLLPQRGAAQRLLDALAHVLDLGAGQLRPAATLSKIDIVGNGLGFWKTIPTARRTADDVDAVAVEVGVVEQDLALGARARGSPRACG